MSQYHTQPSNKLSELLAFQSGFLEQTHSQVYHSGLPLSQAILKFEINHISQINDKFNATISELTKELIDKKESYDVSLREQFQNLLQADYLPLLRINRYEITKLSLFGFDIYVQPLEAFLQILSRMDALKQRIIQTQSQTELAENAETALEEGWDEYSIFAIYWKLSFNIYIFKEYLMVGSKSFLRKDRDILFTGISNLYADLIPILKNRGNIKVLHEFAELNNSLYFFHQSFNYFQFFTFLLPVNDELQPVFAYMKEITQKCLRTKIITPLLFGILRNRQAILRFIREANSQVWLPYLNVIIAGITINLKLRILQYEEILEVLEEAIQRAGLLGVIRTEEILGKLESEWKDAKQFFISAVKIGFNTGDAETWKPVEFQTIGPRIIGSLLNGMLLGIEANAQNLNECLQNGEEKLDLAVKDISEGKVDLYFIKATVSYLQNDLTTERQLFSLIQICNLIKLIGPVNEYSLNFIVSCFNRIAFTPSAIVSLRVTEAASYINQMVLSLESSHLNFLKQRIVDFHRKFTPTTNWPKLIQFYFGNFEPKKCLNHLFALKIQQSDSQQFFQEVLKKCFPKPSNKLITLKTFDKQYVTLNGYINVPYESHCLLNFATTQCIKGNKFAQKIINNLLKSFPWINFALLNFPINEEGALSSFWSCLSDNSDYHNFLLGILAKTKNTVLSESGQDLIKILIYPSILDHVSKRINEKDELNQLKCLCSFLIKIGTEVEASYQFSIDLIALMLYLLEKTEQVQSISSIIQDIAVHSSVTFKTKTRGWLLSLLRKRIEGRNDLAVGLRKRQLKTNNANVYFLGDAIEGPEKSQFFLSNSNQSQILSNDLSEFEKQMKALEIVDGKQLNILDQKQYLDLLEQTKLFSIPAKSQSLLKEIWQKKQQIAINFLSLNLQNRNYFIEQALTTKNLQYLCSQRFDKNLNKYVSSIFQLQQTTKEPILKKMSQNLSLQEKIMISESYFIDSTIISYYCEHIEGLEYLVVFNGNNWRIIMEYLAKQFSLSNLSSIILQFHEFVKITGQKNGEYETIINKYSALFRSFASLLAFKIKAIFSQHYTQQEQNLRSSNELSSLNIIVSSLQLKELLVKLAALNQVLEEKGVTPLSQLVNIVRQLNECINQHYGGEIMLCNFIHSFYYTNEIVCEEHKTQIGIFLEKYEEITNKKTTKMYLPSSISALALNEFTERTKEKGYRIIEPSVPQKLINKEYAELVKQMQQTQLLKVQGKTISLNLCKQVIQNDLKQFYVLGCYHARVGQSQKYQLSPLLKSVCIRQKLLWSVLNQVNPEGYSYIQNIINDSEIGKKDLCFTYRGQSLLPNGESFKVNEYNKIEYCNKIGLLLIGPSALECLKSFMRGFIYQQTLV